MSLRTNDKHGSTLYFIGELQSLSHAVFPGPDVIRVSKLSRHELSAFKSAELPGGNTEAIEISPGVHQQVLHLPNIYVTKGKNSSSHTLTC